MLSPHMVRRAEGLLADGVPKLQVCRVLGISRTSIDKISRGCHGQQAGISAMLAKYYAEHRPRLGAKAAPKGWGGEDGHSVEDVHLVQSLLDAGHGPRAVMRLTGFGKRTIYKVKFGVHRHRHPTPEQLEAYRSRYSGDPHNAASPDTVEKVAALLGDGDHPYIKGAARELGVGYAIALKVSRGEHYWQAPEETREHRSRAIRRIQTSAPQEKRRLTRRQIAERAAAIRRGWTRAEREARWCYSHWTPQVFADNVV